MDESRKFVLRMTALVAIGEVIGVALMVGIFAVIGRFELRVLWGGLAGMAIAVANFFFMAIVAVIAGDKAKAQDVEGGKKLVKTSQLARYFLLAGVLALCAFSKAFNLIALAVPLVLERPILLVFQFFKKKGA